MSTRCNIVVKDNDEITQFYNHYDGGLSSTGDMLEDLCRAYDFDKDPLIIALSEEYEWEYDRERLHFDIDWLYVIDINARSLIAYEPGDLEYTFEKFTIENVKKTATDIYVFI